MSSKDNWQEANVRNTRKVPLRKVSSSHTNKYHNISVNTKSNLKKCIYRPLHSPGADGNLPVLIDFSISPGLLSFSPGVVSRLH